MVHRSVFPRRSAPLVARAELNDVVVGRAGRSERYEVVRHRFHNALVLVGVSVPIINRADTALFVILTRFIASRPKPSAAIVVPCARRRSCGVARSIRSL